MNSKPYFSIVIPVFNREKEVLRAIKSCLAQDFQAFEILVVDDASTDQSAAVVEGLQDKRVRLIRQAQNRGVCPARNTGVQAAAGEWIVFLDSDDEMLPGCLTRSFELTTDPSVTADRFGFLFRYDDGRLSPHPYPTQCVMGYREWLDFAEHALLSDSLWVMKATTFRDCRLPDGRVGEMSYNLDFASKYRTRLVPEIFGLVHTDSADRLSSSKSRTIDWTGARDRARDDVANMGAVLARHGSALRQFAPGKYRLVLQTLIVSHTIGGSRLAGVRNAFHLLLFRPRSPRSWMLLILALLGARAMYRARLRNNRQSNDEARTQHEPSIGCPQVPATGGAVTR
jgi:glycosyltransferase involved in cell wall biosynthesis